MTEWKRPWPIDPDRQASVLAQLQSFALVEKDRKRQRWLLVKEAREAGVPWSAIGDALGVTRQRACQILADSAQWGDRDDDLREKVVRAVQERLGGGGSSASKSSR